MFPVLALVPAADAEDQEFEALLRAFYAEAAPYEALEPLLLDPVEFAEAA